MARSERFKQIRLETIRNLPKEKHTEQSLKIANEIIAAETNHNPVANTDKYSVRVGHTLVVDAKNSVLLNDTDADGDKLEVIPSTVISDNGIFVAINKDGTFTYDAKSAAAGPDSFTYQVSDGHGGVVTGTVKINVVANTPPVANKDVYKVRVGDTLVVNAKNSVLLNDKDADGDKLEVIPAKVKSDKGIDVTIDKDSIFTYSSTIVGLHSFPYTVIDGHGGRTIGTVEIDVEPASTTPPPACPACVGNLKDLAKKVSEGGQHKLFVTKAVEFKKGIEDDKSAGTTNYLDSAGKVRDAVLKDLLKIGEYTFDTGVKSSTNLCTKSSLDSFCKYGLIGKDRLLESQVNVFLEKSERLTTLAKIEKKICTDLKLSGTDINCIKGYVQDFCSDTTLTTGTNANDPEMGVCIAGGMDYLDHIVCL